MVRDAVERVIRERVQAETPPSSPGNTLPDWAVRLRDQCRKDIGDVDVHHLVRRLRPFVDREGVGVISDAMGYYSAHRQTLGKPATFDWFLQSIAEYIEGAKEGVVTADGDLTPFGHRITYHG